MKMGTTTTKTAEEQRIADRLELIHTHLIQRAELVRHTIDQIQRGDVTERAIQVIHDLVWTPANMDISGLTRDVVKAAVAKQTKENTRKVS